MKPYRAFASIGAIVALAAFVACGSDDSGGGIYGSGGGSGSSTTGSATTGTTGGTTGTTGGDASTPGQVMVTIPPGAMNLGTAAYGPNPLTVTMGTTVTWMNGDSIPHTATSDTGVFDSGTLGPGQTYSFTFTTPGTYPYHCAIHGAASMSGTVQVNP